MNIPISWLREYVDIDCDTKAFGEAMTMTGSKVEAVRPIGYDISNVVVGKVLSVEKHPDADKLVVCQLDTGRVEPVQIVTAATNVVPGAYVPVALDGAVLANGLKIKKGKLRGQLSDGMMVSVEEFGYTLADFPEADAEGIYLFQDEYPLGADVCPILELRDEIVEFELTSNRPDCYSVVGIAREAAATLDKPLRYKNADVNERAGGCAADMISVEIKNEELCPRYAARVVKNVTIGPSPQWIRRRLSKAGLRPINNIVDITNYVMLELGQPMHAFDIDNINEGRIIVRNANDGEAFTTLDGTKRMLDSDMLVIADSDKAVAVAGVMGGENSMVTGKAGAILLESANFKAGNVRRTSKKLGLRTDASSRYEKGLDPDLCLEAVNRAAGLIEELGCGEAVAGVVDCYPRKREAHSVVFAPDRVNALLGVDISEPEMVGYLSRVGIRAQDGVAYVPTFRADIKQEADIAEEIARIYGYDNIPVTMVRGTPTIGKLNRKQIIEDIVRNTMTASGLCEAMTYSFESPKVFARLRLPEDSPLRNAITVANPLGEDFSLMRTTPINGMLTSLATNFSKRNEEARLFEVAKVYLPKSLPVTELPYEKDILSIGMYGDIDFYDIKGVLELLFGALGISAGYSAERGIPFFHPGRCARVSLDEAELGCLGEVHPAVCEEYGLPRAYMAVLNLGYVIEVADLSRSYKPLPKFPGIQRDIALLVDDATQVKLIEEAICQRGGKYLEDVKLFDVYRGKQVEDGKKSVAYKLSFRASDRTLTDDEASRSVKKILEHLRDKMGAVLRG